MSALTKLNPFYVSPEKFLVAAFEGNVDRVSKWLKNYRTCTGLTRKVAIKIFGKDELLRLDAMGLAALNNQFAVIQLLLNDPDSRTFFFQPGRAVGCLETLAKNKNTASLKLLIEAGILGNASIPRALCSAAKCGNLSAMRVLLNPILEKVKIVLTKDTAGVVVSYLLPEIINTKSSGNPPLASAIYRATKSKDEGDRKESFETVQLLLNHGADPRQLVHFYDNSAVGMIKRTALQYAIYIKAPENLIELLDIKAKQLDSEGNPVAPIEDDPSVYDATIEVAPLHLDPFLKI